MPRTAFCALAALVLLAGCDDAPSDPDGATPRDAASRDAGAPTDSGTGMDAGPSRDGGAGMDAGADASEPIDAALPPIDAGPSSDRHTARPLGTTAAGNGYYEYLPPRYGDGNDHPLLVFWHGIGENGDGTTELDRVLRAGPPRLIARDEWPNDRPFIVLSAQHSGGGCPSANEIHDFITYAMTSYDVDVSRVYLTGLSCGAIGSWNYFGQYIDEQIAAIVVIAGDGRGAWNRAGCELGRVPIWAFHGDADPTVSPQGTIVPMTNLMACDPAPPEANMTIYPGVAHDSWTRTYNLSAGHDIYEWMLRFRHP